MITIQGLNQLGPELTYLDLNPSLGLGTSTPHQPNLLEKAPTAPKMIREADLRPHTMKVKGKSNPNSIIMSKDQGVPSAESMMPHYGNFRNQTKGLLYPGVLHKAALDGSLKPRPDSAFGYLDTKFAEPK